MNMLSPRRNGVYAGLAALILAGALAAMSYRAVVHTAPSATFGDVSLRIELATSTEAQERGLGGRTSLPDDYGMLFVFKKADTYGFWMKDMLLPIDIFWLDNQGQVIAVTPKIAPATYPNVFYPPRPVHYVLETTAGFAHKHHIEIGTSLSLQNSPPVSQ